MLHAQASLHKSKRKSEGKQREFNYFLQNEFSHTTRLLLNNPLKQFNFNTYPYTIFSQE